MRKLLLLIVVVVSSLLTTKSFAWTVVSSTDALTVAQREFQGQDVDYYLMLNSDNSTFWQIFVDAEPMKGWEHDCYTLLIPKTSQEPLDQLTPTHKILSQIPPQGDYQPLSVKNRYGAKANVKPKVEKQAVSHVNSSTPSSIANRTYAIILSGGISPMSNHERYWNDCSFIYQVLTNKYGIPKSNIYPIMSDGDDPGEDMRTTSNSLVSQPLDLDYDNVADIQLAATRENVQSTLETISNKIEKDDQLFIYVIDHGGKGTKDTYIRLWNYKNLYPYDLAAWLKPIIAKSANINVVLGQCHAGGFIQDLQKSGCVVATACAANESSYSCPDIPFDEFVYHWTSAINGKNHASVTVNSDLNGDGYISMEEAFIYAKQNDRYSNGTDPEHIEHPQYASTPLSIGEDLAFDRIAPSVDLYIKDNPEDTGKEPNLTTDAFWKSPSICVRNQDDGIFEHENPYYSDTHKTAVVYVRVHNRGKGTFEGKNKWILLYWAKASTGISTKTWKGREVNYNDDPTGGVCYATPIATRISPGGYADIKIDWLLPPSMAKDKDDNFHYCLLAKIMDTPYDDGYQEGNTYFDLRGSNKQAQKNVSIIKATDFTKGAKVFIRNTSNSDQAYSLELIPQTSTDAELYSRAKIYLEISPIISNAWKHGGYENVNMELLPTDLSAPHRYTVQFLSPDSKIQNILLRNNEFGVVTLKLEKKPVINTAPRSSTFDLIQRDEDGNIVGGETFIIEEPYMHITIPSDPIIGVTPITNENSYNLSIEDNGYHSITWKDQNNNEISNSETVKVTPYLGNSKFEVQAMYDDGEIVCGDVSLEDYYGIKDVAISSNNLHISLKQAAPNNASIKLTSALDGSIKYSAPVVAGTDVTDIDTSALEPGIYLITYYNDDIILDQTKVNL